jgi:hypothetical protein
VAAGEAVTKVIVERFRPSKTVGMDDVIHSVAPRHVARNSRRRSLVLPREHGAWGILLIPLLSGAAVGLTQILHPAPVLLLLVAAIALFWLRTPVESLVGSGPMRVQTPAERRFVITWIALISPLAALAVAGLLWHGQNLLLLPLGCVAGAAFLAQAMVRRWGRRARMAAQVIGALGLTSTAAAACYVVTGQLDQRALALWLANWLFASLQIQFVQLQIHGAKLKIWAERLKAGKAFLMGEALLVLVLIFAWRWREMPAVVLIAFLPLLVRGVAWFFRRPQPLDVHRLGFVELSHAIAFGALLSLAFALR